jgi:hypothetical protein
MEMLVFALQPRAITPGRRSPCANDWTSFTPHSYISSLSDVGHPATVANYSLAYPVAQQPVTKGLERSVWVADPVAPPCPDVM